MASPRGMLETREYDLDALAVEALWTHAERLFRAEWGPRANWRAIGLKRRVYWLDRAIISIGGIAE